MEQQDMLRADEETQSALRPQIDRNLANIIADPVAHADGRLLQALAQLRREQPLGIASADGFNPFWVVTRQADLRAMATRPDDFLNGGPDPTLISRAASEQMQQLLEGRDFPVRGIIYMDRPDHPLYRAVASEFFHARNLDTLAGQVRATAAGFVDHMLGFDGACDFARDVAFLYPLRVIMQIIGVPREDEPLMLRLSKEFIGASDEDLARDGAARDGAELGQALVDLTRDFSAYFDRMMEDRRAHPRNDLVSVIANATIDGVRMPDLEARSYCFIAATAGHDTTASVTAGGMLALCRNPGLLDQIRDDPEQIKAFVEEATRLYTPVKVTMRRAAADIEFAGRQFLKGDWIAMAWASGNRDEAVFEDPDSFRMDRRPNKLISYGNGPHVCLGQHLARLEMRTFFEELTRKVETVELAGEPKGMASFFVSGLKSLPIRFTPRR